MKTSRRVAVPKSGLTFLGKFPLWVYLCSILNFFIHLPSIGKELMPYQFCDESIFSFQVHGMLNNGSNVTNEFRAGGYNIYPVLALLRIFTFVNPVSLDFNSVLLAGRVLMVQVPNILICFVIYILVRELNLSSRFGLVGNALVLLSPLIFGISRLWYPDHYIFFYSSLLVLYIVRILDNTSNKSDYFAAGCVMGIIISIKYTGLLLLPILIFLVLSGYLRDSSGTDRKLRRKLWGRLNLVFFSSLVIVLILFNFSLIFEFQKFVQDFNFNLANYSKSPGIRYSGFFFYLYQIFVVSWFPTVVIFWCIGAVELFRRSGYYFFTFVAIPILIVFYLGMAGTVINRNITFILPFFFVGIILGIQKAIALKGAIGKFSFTVLLAAMFLNGIITVGVALSQDLKEDSRTVAESWIAQELPVDAFIGTNEFCSGPSPARDISKNIYIDEIMKKDYEYYIFNSYYPSVLFPYYQSKNILQTTSQEYTHFYHFNDANVLKWNTHDKLSKFVPSGYKILKRFAFDGPEIVILKRVDSYD
jgi:hypothetical protein